MSKDKDKPEAEDGGGRSVATRGCLILFVVGIALCAALTLCSRGCASDTWKGVEENLKTSPYYGEWD